MDHRGDVEFDQFFVQRIPPAVEQRRVAPVAAGRIGIEVHRDEAVSFHAALEFGDAVVRPHARRLRQLPDADEIVGIELADPMDQFVGNLRPFGAGFGGADVMAHAARARREQRHVGAALALEI